MPWIENVSGVKKKKRVLLISLVNNKRGSKHEDIWSGIAFLSTSRKRSFLRDKEKEEGVHELTIFGAHQDHSFLLAQLA